MRNKEKIALSYGIFTDIFVKFQDLSSLMKYYRFNKYFKLAKNDWRIIEASNDIVKTSDFLKFVENDYELNITLYRKDKVSMRDEVLIDLNRKINLYTDVFWTPKDIQTVFKVGSSKAYEIIRTVNHKYKRVNQKPLRAKVSNVLDYYDIDLDFQVQYIKKILDVIDLEGGTNGDK